MHDLVIEKTDATPLIKLEGGTGNCLLEGDCYPENAVIFFEPVLNWFSAVQREQLTLRICFRLTYFNSSSSKALLDLLDLLTDHARAGGDVMVVWSYAADDEDLYESGLEFADGAGFPFELIAESPE